MDERELVDQRANLLGFTAHKLNKAAKGGCAIIPQGSSASSSGEMT
jgi:hypothetical protein